ncbi:MAG: bifunctional diaminohydroxyphosphoribosylaminopyrimidine deaminase/5-amino-6-(5-phosphoribosylamino)uracil reductase RibD [bacterium]
MTDIIYMQRCLQLAQQAEGKTTPNPMVGAVIVCDDKIIGEGYHHRAGEPHAEPNAIASVQDKELLKNSTMYVSLEPCSHYGKTPPCADLIVSMGIKRVVVATLDPNPRVAGRGVEIMQRAGIEVEVGVLENEARYLNRRFMTFQEKKRPYIILKWAETADGYIDKLRQEKGNGPVKISNSITKTLNHQVRTQEDAIMVATRTALLDDPHLTVTKWSGKNPVRVLLDRRGVVPADARIFDAAAKTLVFTSQEVVDNRTCADNIELIALDFSKSLPEQVLHQLYLREIQSVIVEGGTQWLQTFIDETLWDEARIEKSMDKLDSGVASPNVSGVVKSSELIEQNRVEIIIPTK